LGGIDRSRRGTIFQLGGGMCKRLHAFSFFFPQQFVCAPHKIWGNLRGVSLRKRGSPTGGFQKRVFPEVSTVYFYRETFFGEDISGFVGPINKKECGQNAREFIRRRGLSGGTKKWWVIPH